jgi:hypothetical protein
MTTAVRVEKRIAQRLANALQPGSPNEVSAASVREWALEYLAWYCEMLTQCPQSIGDTHWDLMIQDGRWEDALFAVLIFRPDGIEFFCGTGEALAIREFAESSNQMKRLLEKMQKRFLVPDESLHLKLKEAEAWLGRGGWCG